MFFLLFCLLVQCSCGTQVSWKSCSNCVLQILLLHAYTASIPLKKKKKKTKIPPNPKNNQNTSETQKMTKILLKQKKMTKILPKPNKITKIPLKPKKLPKYPQNLKITKIGWRGLFGIPIDRGRLPQNLRTSFP